MPADPRRKVLIKPHEQRLEALLSRLREQLQQHPVFAARAMFCLFGDCAGIWRPGTFRRLIEGSSADNLSERLQRFFDALGDPDEQHRKNVCGESPSPFVGSLFNASGDERETVDLGVSAAAVRRTLIECCALDWGEIGPVAFGAVFEGTMGDGERRSSGSHYTSTADVRRVIDPLFMDDLRKEYQDANGRKGDGRAKALEKFHAKLGRLKFLDPACGCGNFLIVGYKCLRELEMDVIRSRRHAMGQYGRKETAQIPSVVGVDQFHGIEIGEFQSKIAESGLWMSERLLNHQLSQDCVRSPVIHCADALEMDWADVCPPAECSFVMGNPPFIGYPQQTERQKAQRNRIMHGRGGMLDYAACWFRKTAEYMRHGAGPSAFVSSNSICQGVQAADLWPIILRENEVEIFFARQSFPWRGDANVHVAAIGMATAGRRRKKRLFARDGGREMRVRAISPYLTDASAMQNPNLVVTRTAVMLNGLPAMTLGCNPVDGGFLNLSEDERKQLLRDCPQSRAHVRPFIGARQLLNGGERYILCLADAPPEVMSAPSIARRLDAVREARSASKKKGTRDLAASPERFYSGTPPDAPFLMVPRTSSERRICMPIGYERPPAVPSDAVYTIPNASKSLFALLSSGMHRAWVAGVGGRMKSDLRYSAECCYRTFPVPDGALQKLAPFGEAVLGARAKHPGRTLAELYATNTMPADLRIAHQHLDAAVDTLYRPTPFADDAARMECLLIMYERMAAPMLATAPTALKRERVSIQERRNRKQTPHCMNARAKRKADPQPAQAALFEQPVPRRSRTNTVPSPP